MKMLNTFTGDGQSRCEIIRASHDKFNEKLLKKAAKILIDGGIIIYPTDTLYGFGIAVGHVSAFKKIFKIKQRTAQKPFSVMVNRIEQIEEICGVLDAKEREIYQKLMPGKITLLIKVRKIMSLPGLKDLQKIGFRNPASTLCQQLVEFCGCPISSSSVNLANKPNISDPRQIADEFSDQVDLIIDAGPVKSSKGSSVLDLTTRPIRLLREGEVSREELADILQMPIAVKNENKYKILFICSGNICRSPMAEGILKKMINRSEYSNQVEISSAGTLELPSSKASPEAITVSKENQIDISAHLSTPLNKLLIAQSDIIFCMEQNHIDTIQRQYADTSKNVHLLKKWQNRNSAAGGNIEDPIGSDLQFYRFIFREIENELERIWPFLTIEIRRKLTELI